MTRQVFEVAPVTTQLAQHLADNSQQSFRQSWQHLCGMLPASISSPLVSTPHDLVPDEATMASVEQHFMSRYTVPMDNTHCSSALLKLRQIRMVTWNVRGLQSSMPGVLHILDRMQPLALILTETHLKAKDASQQSMRNMHPDYNIFSTCHSEVNPLDMLHTGSRAILQQRNRAGVLVAVHKAFVKYQYCSKHAVPKQLQGFMTHISCTALILIPYTLLEHTVLPFRALTGRWCSKAYLTTSKRSQITWIVQAQSWSWQGS